jgi:hypothetical protein
MAIIQTAISRTVGAMAIMDSSVEMAAFSTAPMEGTTVMVA